MSDSFWYPSVADVLAIHSGIVSEYTDTETGVKSPGDVEFALDYIRNEGFQGSPERIHQKAFHLLRLLVANHPFVDGNKRTALNTAVVFYFLNGYRFEYDNEIRPILKQFGTDETTVDESETVAYLRSHTAESDLAEEIDQWRSDLIEYGLGQLTDDYSDPND